MKRDIKNLYRDEQEGASKERTRREQIIHPFISSLAFHSIFASKETSGQKMTQEFHQPITLIKLLVIIKTRQDKDQDLIFLLWISVLAFDLSSIS